MKILEWLAEWIRVQLEPLNFDYTMQLHLPVRICTDLPCMSFHTILQCKFSKETLNSIKAKVAVSLEPTESDYFKMNFVGSFSIDSDSIQLLIYQISANFIWQKKWRRHLENQPICLIPDCQHQPAQTLKGCLHIFYYIKMAQIWHRGSWILSLSILKDPTKIILK